MSLNFIQEMKDLQLFDMYQQNNSPSRSYNANIGLNGPQPQLSGQGPSLSLQGSGNQYGNNHTSNHISSHGQGQFSAQGPSLNHSGPSREAQFSTGQTTFNNQGQGPSVSLSGPGSTSYNSHQQSSFNAQGPSVNLSGPGSRQYNINQQSSSFNGQGSSLNGPDFNSRGQFSGPEVNVSMGGQGQGGYSMNGPDMNMNMHQGGFDGGFNAPTSSAGLRQHITKLPYTENIDGEDITYSVIPKKQQSFVMTHDRFLLLKGIEILGYARELDQKAQLPFRSLANVPSPKTVVQLSNIQRVEVQDVSLIVRHADQQKTVWEFVCPSKRCAVEWNQKINDAMALLREFQMSGFGSPAEFYQFKNGNIGNRDSHSPPVENSPPRFNAGLSNPPLNSSPPRVETNANYRVNHDDEVSRSVYDNSGPKANQGSFGSVNYNVNSSPVKNQSYDVNYNVNQPQNVGMNMNANYQGSQGGSTYGSSGRSFTISSSSSLGRYPMGMPMGGQQHVMEGRSNYRNV